MTRLAPALLLALAPVAAPADTASLATQLETAAIALQGDVGYGEYLASECLTCHQASGADAGIPAIVGWPHDALIVALVEYKLKIRRHPVMETVTADLGPEELAALAAYLNGVAPAR